MAVEGITVVGSDWNKENVGKFSPLNVSLIPIIFFINDIHSFQLERSIYWALESVIICLFIVCALCFPVSISAAEILISGQLTTFI